MRIEIINVQAATKPTKTGKTYVQLDVAYKNLTREGKIEGKKIMPFQNPDVHANLQKATMGQVFEVTTVKEGEYWQWSNVQEVAKGGNMEPQTSAASSGYASKGTPSPKSTYETPEERAARQRLIVRQSCLSNAVETLKVDKKGVDPTEALKLAERYVGWVFGEEAKVDVPDVGFDSMEDDIPF
jgi:hypothetical protein